MSDEECIHLLDPTTCSLCRPKGKTRAMRDFRQARRSIHASGFQAQYDGQCFECGGDISAGDYIAHRDDGGYRHVECDSG